MAAETAPHRAYIGWRPARYLSDFRSPATGVEVAGGLDRDMAGCRGGKAMRLLKLLLVLLACLPLCLRSRGQLRRRCTAYDRGDYATALRLYRALADTGDAAAQYSSASCTTTGKACRRTTRRQHRGTERLPSRAMPPLRTTSASCTPRARRAAGLRRRSRVLVSQSR